MFNTAILSNKESKVTNILEYSNREDSFFKDTLVFVSESLSDYRDVNKRLYKSILESEGDSEVINESFSDFFASVKKIIDKFLKFIKSLFDRFIIALHKFIASDKFIVKNKDKFKNFNEKHNFDIQGYNYSFSPAVPLINAEAKFDESFVKLDFAELQGITDQKVLLAKVDEKYGQLVDMLDVDWYDKFRGDVIGTDPIAQEDYANSLFEVYRDGSSSKDKIEITSSYVLTSLARFENYKKDEKSVKDTKEKIDKDYEQVKKQIQSIIKQNSTKDINNLIQTTIDPEYSKAGTGALTVSTDVMNKIDLFVKKKVEQVVEMTSIHSLAYSYKLDAIKDCYKQDKEILYKALTKITKDTAI